jgi:hypothetical protein
MAGAKGDVAAVFLVPASSVGALLSASNKGERDQS